MRLRSLIALLGLASASFAAHAQVGIYGNFSAIHFTDNNQHTTTWFYGPGVGVYYNFLHAGPIALGADVRGNYLVGDQQKYRSALVGLRLAVNPPLLPIRPYVQGSIGGGGARYNSTAIVTNPTFSTKFQYQVAGGLDLTIFPHIDFRIAEVAYGKMSGVSGGSTAPSASLVTISSGIVFRLP